MAIAAAGGIEVLIALARHGTEAQKEEAAGALWNLSANDDNSVAIAAAGGVEVLVSLARDGNEAQKERAAGALCSGDVKRRGVQRACCAEAAWRACVRWTCCAEMAWRACGARAVKRRACG